MVAKRTDRVLPILRSERTIFAAEYKPKLIFYSLLMSATEKFEARYKHWRTDIRSLTFFDYERHCSLHVSHSKFGYEQDSNDISQGEEDIAEAIAELTDGLRLTSYRRLGFRRKYLLPMKIEFDELVTITKVKLYSENPRLKDIILRSVDDLMFRVDTSEGDFKCHIVVGPVRKSEIARHMEVNEDLHFDPESKVEDLKTLRNGYPDVAVYFDIDVYMEADEISIDRCPDFFSAAREKSSKIVGDMSDYLLSK